MASKMVTSFWMTATRATAAMPSTRPAPATTTSRTGATPTALPRCTQGDDLWRYLDGELPAARARAVARHVPTCPDCTVRARRLRAMLEECRSAGGQQLPGDVRARARARMRALVRSGRP